MDTKGHIPDDGERLQKPPSRDALYAQIRTLRREMQVLNLKLNEWQRQPRPFRLHLRRLGRLFSLHGYYTLKWWARHFLAVRPWVKPVVAPDSPDFRPYVVRTPGAGQAHRPRVLHFIANLVTGGSARLIVDLVEHLGDRFDHRIIVKKRPVPDHYVGLQQTERDEYSTSDEVLGDLVAIKPDLIHIHYLANPDVDYSVREYHWYHLIFEAIERYRRTASTAVIQNVNIPVVPYISDAVDSYVYVSAYVRQRYGLYADNECVIYPGSDLGHFDRRGQAVPDDTIGMVYRLQPDKLDEHAISPFIHAIQRRPGTRAIIVGGGFYMDRYRAAVARAGQRDSFTFTGYRAYQELPALLSQLSVFVAPVHSESFGQVSPFAMGMGIPVVGYDVGALAEIVGDAEWLAPPGDVDRLADLIVRLLDDRARRLEIGARNRRRADERFSVGAMTEAYERLYRRVLNRVHVTS